MCSRKIRKIPNHKGKVGRSGSKDHIAQDDNDGVQWNYWGQVERISLDWFCRVIFPENVLMLSNTQNP